MPLEQGTRTFAQRRRARQGATIAESPHRGRDRRPVPVHQVEHQALEVARHLDIHAGRQRRLDPRDRHVAVGKEAIEDVVPVRRHDQPIDRQAHLPRHISGIDIAEVPGRHDECDGLVRRAEPGRGGKIIGGLAHHPRPVDRVDRGQAERIAQRVVGEQRLHQVLAVVEGAADGEVEDIVGDDRRHLPPLDLRDASLGMQHEDVEIAATPARLDGRRPGVAGRCPDDGDPRATARQHMLEQPAEELEGEVLEREGRAVEQLEQPGVVVELAQRGDVGGREPGIGLAGQPGERRVVEEVRLDEGADDPRGDLGIVECGERPNIRARNRGPMRGHEQAAVAGEPAQQHVLEAWRRRATPGAQIFHIRSSAERRANLSNGKCRYKAQRLTRPPYSGLPGDPGRCRD